LPATEGTWRLTSRAAASGPWFDRAVVASVCIVLALGVFLVIRRAIGAIEAPLPALPLVATAIGLAAWAICVRTTWRPQLGAKRRALQSQLPIWLPAIAISFFAVGCSFPGQRVIDWLAWTAALLAFIISTRLLDRIRVHSRCRVPRSAAIAEATDSPIQQLTRYRAADGTQSIHGTLIAEFAPGERSATLYVAFCPPFERLPSIEAEAIDNSSASVKLTQLLHNGAQVDVRLPQPANEKQTVTVEIVASDASE